MRLEILIQYEYGDVDFSMMLVLVAAGQVDDCECECANDDLSTGLIGRYLNLGTGRSVNRWD